MSAKELIRFAENFGYECGAYQNLHPKDREQLSNTAKECMNKILEGMAIVPLEPSDEMIEAGSMCGSLLMKDCEKSAADVYGRMIQAHIGEIEE